MKRKGGHLDRVYTKKLAKLATFCIWVNLSKPPTPFLWSEQAIKKSFKTLRKIQIMDLFSLLVLIFNQVVVYIYSITHFSEKKLIVTELFSVLF